MKNNIMKKELIKKINKTMNFIKFVQIGFFLFFLIGVVSCDKVQKENTQEIQTIKTSVETEEKDTIVKHISAAMNEVQNYIPSFAVIAHRGSTYWTPEETESAYRWARNTGADYLEADLQITKDGVIIVLHDDNLTRTTNIAEIFPDRKNNPASSFTYEELMRLDAGSWFNRDNPGRAKSTYAREQQYISTLEDLIMFAEGKRLKRDPNTKKRIWVKRANGAYRFEYEADPADNGHRPGIYLETKEPHLNPGIENTLYTKLDQLGWNILTQPANSSAQFKDGKVNVGNTNGRVVLQTFSLKSLSNLKSVFQGKIPTTLLLWKGEGDNDLRTDDKVTYTKFINYGVDNLAQFIGPSIGGKPNDYYDLLQKWESELIQESGMKIHPYSFDSEEQMEKYFFLCNGMFTNRAEVTINFYIKKGVRKCETPEDPEKVLRNLGYL